jgi:hypothetical protein
MKIVTRPALSNRFVQHPNPARGKWVAEFIASVGDVTEVCTHLRDNGNAVRFRFPDGVEVEWPWQEISPRDAAIEYGLHFDKISMTKK